MDDERWQQAFRLVRICDILLLAIGGVGCSRLGRAKSNVLREGGIVEAEADNVAEVETRREFPGRQNEQGLFSVRLWGAPRCALALAGCLTALTIGWVGGRETPRASWLRAPYDSLDYPSFPRDFF